MPIQKGATLEELQALLKEPESASLECKEAKGNYPVNKLCKHCCAVANSGGGNIVLGVASTVPRRVVGTEACANPKDAERRIAAALKPAIKVEVAEVKHPQGRVVVVIVPPRANGGAVSYEGVFYKNAGGRLAAMSFDDIARIVSETAGHWLDEICIAGLRPMEVVSLLDVGAFYRMSGGRWPDKEGRIMKDLANAGILAPAQDGGGFSITRMGVLLLAESIEQCTNEVASKRFTVTRYKGTAKKGTRMFHRSFDKGHVPHFDHMMTSTLGQMYNPYVIEGAHGRVIEFVPHAAVRELVLNAIIHQDFGGDGNAALDIYDDRVEITNPGETLTGLDRIIDKQGSRNPQLLRAMRKLGMASQAGAGIDRIIDILEREQAAPLEVVAEGGETKVTLFHKKGYGKMTKRLKKTALYQHCVLKHVAGEMMTNGSARARFKLGTKNRVTIWRLIKELVDEGKIKPSAENKSSNKYASYLPYWA